jgi:type I restriction enzyme S subunit
MTKELTMAKTSLPVGWEMKTLGEGCVKTETVNPKTNPEKEFIYLDVSSVNKETKLIEATTTLLGKDAPSRARKLVKKDDVIFATVRPTHSRVALIPEDYNEQVCSTGYYVLRAKPIIENQFIFYYLLTDFFNELMESMQKGASYPAVTNKEVESVKIPLPPLPQQKQIVAILDNAFAAIDTAKANAKQNLQNAKELFESYLQNVFENKGDDWEEKTIGDIGKPSMCKRILKQQTSSDGDIPFYKIGTFGKKPNAFISKELYEEYKTKYSFPKKGDILISASGTIGRRVIYDGKPGFFQDSNIVWIDNDETQVLNEYLYSFYGFCDWQPSKGATISRLYNANLKRIKISFPKSLEKQKNVIREIEEISSKTKKLEAIYTQKIADLEEMKKSVLQKAFSGQLSEL